MCLSRTRRSRLVRGLILSVLVLSVLGGQVAEAQRVRVDVGAGWALPTSNVELSKDAEVVIEQLDIDGNVASRDTGTVPLGQPVDLTAGRHLYLGVGFVRSIGDRFALGFRLRGHASELRSSVDCRFRSTCGDASGTLWIGTVEGRIILTSPDWIDPYLLVGIGVAHTSFNGVTLRNVKKEVSRQQTVEPTAERLAFPDVSITDVGGDVGIGASIPLAGGLELDAEFRASGSLPGGKENTVTALPLTLGLSYSFR